jgi:hypothetical protein
MNNLKVFAVSYQSAGPVAPAGFFTFSFTLPLQNQLTKIRSLTWDWKIITSAAAANFVTKYNNAIYTPLIIITNPGGGSVASPVNSLAGTINTNGDSIRIFETGQYKWESFFASNDLQINYTSQNLDAALSVTPLVSIIIEVEIIPPQ